MTITDLSTEGLLTRMVERIDAAAERAWGPMESLRDSGIVRPLSPTPTAKSAAFRRRVEAVILDNPTLRTGLLADLANVSPNTIQRYREKLRQEGKI